MSKKTTLHATLAYHEENCAHREYCLNELPVIHANTEQLNSDWHNTFKYFQGESHFCNI
jgi:hypothetical protein